MSIHPFVISGMVVGLLLSVAGHLAEKRHSRLFEQHIERLNRAPDEETIAAEVEMFHADQRLDRLISVMFLEPIGWVLFMVSLAAGLFLL